MKGEEDREDDARRQKGSGVWTEPFKDCALIHGTRSTGVTLTVYIRKSVAVIGSEKGTALQSFLFTEHFFGNLPGHFTRLDSYRSFFTLHRDLRLFGPWKPSCWYRDWKAGPQMQKWENLQELEKLNKPIISNQFKWCRAVFSLSWFLASLAFLLYYLLM